MESDSPTRRSNDGSRKGSFHSYIRPRLTPNTTTMVGCTYKNDDAGRHTCEEYNRLSQNVDADNSADVVKTFPRTYDAHNCLDGQLHYIPLSAQALNEHNLQQANMHPAAQRVQHATQPEHTTTFEVTTISTDESIQHRNSTRAFENKFLPANFRYQTQGKRQSTTSMYNEADSDAPNYQSADHWQSRLSDHAHVTDSPGPDLYDASPLSWDAECSSQSQELTAWGNALAGVGEHLVERNFQDYADEGELVVE